MRIKEIIENPSEKIVDPKNGKEAFWSDKHQTIVIKDPQNPDLGTAFKPKIQKKYFLDLIEKWGIK